MLGIALVRRGRHQQEMVGHLRQGRAQTVGIGLVLFAPGAHLVGLVHDHQIPTGPEEAFSGIFDERYPRDGGDGLVVVLPRVLAVVGPQQAARDDLELLAELVGHFPLPLEGQVRRGDDQRPLDQPSGLQFLERQAAHDGLSGTGIVGQQEANARQAKKINDQLVRFAWQERTIDEVRKLNGCGEGKPWGEHRTLYPSKGGTPVVTYIHSGGHQFPQDVPPVIVKFFKQQAKP